MGHSICCSMRAATAGPKGARQGAQHGQRVDRRELPERLRAELRARGPGDLRHGRRGAARHPAQRRPGARGRGGHPGRDRVRPAVHRARAAGRDARHGRAPALGQAGRPARGGLRVGQRGRACRYRRDRRGPELEGGRERRAGAGRRYPGHPQRRPDRRRPPGGRHRRAHAARRGPAGDRPGRGLPGGRRQDLRHAEHRRQPHHHGQLRRHAGGLTMPDVEVYGKMLSTLPDDDDHPYRTGPWRPQNVEYDAEDLRVTGDLPDDLYGVYLRNTETPLHPAIVRYHPFDGDGMIHKVSFRDGKVSYRNRFVRTEGLLAEQEAGRSLWAGRAENPSASTRADGWGARGRMKDAASTDVIVYAGVAVASFYQCGDLYRLDPLTLDDLGKCSWGGSFPSDLGVSAHTKVDDRTGELLFFNYSTTAPYLHYGVEDAGNHLVHYVPIDLPGPRLPHDMAFTEHYAILNDMPLFCEPDLIARARYAARYHPELPARLGVIPRRGGTGDIRWFEFDPTYVLHWVNAFQDGDEIVVDGFFQGCPE